MDYLSLANRVMDESSEKLALLTYARRDFISSFRYMERFISNNLDHVEIKKLKNIRDKVEGVVNKLEEEISIEERKLSLSREVSKWHTRVVSDQDYHNLMSDSSLNKGVDDYRKSLEDRDNMEDLRRMIYELEALCELKNN